MSEPAIAHPAATVVLMRDCGEGCEVLLVRRNVRLAFHGGHWVFPGGRLDAEDYDSGADVLEAAKSAAVREAREEAGVEVVRDELVLVSRWVTPDILPKRFDTWFFAAPARGDTVQVDGSEIHDYRWMPPRRALEAQRAGEIELPPPTYVTLLQMSEHATVAAAISAVAARPAEVFLPRLHQVPGGACTVYHGDAGYEDGDLERPGPRHRLFMIPPDWRYERRS